MEFKFEDYNLKTDVISQEVKKSEHTGNSLEILDISFKTSEKFNNPDFLYSEDKKWKIASSSSSYTQGDSITRYNWTIEEVEELKIEKIVINDIMVEPYLYGESIEKSSGNALEIQSAAEISKDTWQKIYDTDPGEYFPVIRQGISEEEKQMRFGQILWSEYGDNIKCCFILIEKIYDDFNKPISFLDPQVPNIKTNLLETIKIVENLLNLLSDKAVITNEEKKLVKSVNEEEINVLAFNKVRDLDKFIEDSERYEHLEKVDS